MAKMIVSVKPAPSGPGQLFMALLVIGLMCMAYTAVLIGLLFVTMCVCAFVGTRLAIKARDQRREQINE